MNISRPFILRPIATSLLMVALFLVGIVAYQQLPISALPQVDYPTIQIVTLYPGASPDVTASSITAPLERQFGQLPGLNQMFDIVTTRTMAAKTHPPTIVFVMLGIMACVAAFMAGHGMSGSKVRSWVHNVGFAAILALTVFVILDLEFPRLGFIRVNAFDQVLVDLRQSMK